MKFFLVLYINLLLGIIGMFLSTKNKNKTDRIRLWKKFYMYIFILHIMFISCLYFNQIYLIIVFIITFTSIYEIYNVTKLNSTIFKPVIATLSFILIGFLYFNFKSNVYTIALVYSIVMLFDGFSQIFGIILGKIKLAPTISPNKTIEGVIGGAFVAFFTYFFLTNSSIHFSSLIIVVFIIVASLFGDLAASFVKRKVGIKDFSNLIPTHGGILDRFDSFLLACFTANIIHLFNINF